MMSFIIPLIADLAWTLAAFIVALSIIVAVHEFGHYIVGRWCGIRAEVFSIGFGPALWSRIDRRGTRWQIAALPFGGYVKFLGDANAASTPSAESMTGLSPEEARHTLAGAPIWAKVLTVLAGPVFNFLLSIAIFTLILIFSGQPKEPLTVGEVPPLPVEVELQPGDVILAIEGQPLPTSAYEADRFYDTLPARPLLDWTVLRDGREVTVKGPHPVPPLVKQLAPRSAAIDAGLRPGDYIMAVDGEPVYAFWQVKQKVEAAQGRPLTLTVWRKGETHEFTLAPRRVDEPQPGGGFETHWRVGIAGGLFFEPATEPLDPLTALEAGIAQTWAIIVGSLSGLWHMITGAISSCNLSGPVGIAEVSGQAAAQGAQNFLWFIAVLSTAVGLLNLFPVPMLDGGHLVFFAWEAATGRLPSEKVMRALMSIGLTLVLALMMFALFNDLFCP